MPQTHDCIGLYFQVPSCSVLVFNILLPSILLDVLVRGAGAGVLLAPREQKSKMKLKSRDETRVGCIEENG